MGKINKQIAILVPSKGRPDIAKRLVESIQKFSEGFSDIILGVENQELKDYKKIKNVSIIQTPATDYAPRLNFMVENLPKKYKYFYLLNDDFVFETPFESKFLEIAEQLKNCILYGDDGIQHQELPTAPFIDYNVYKVLGFVCPPEFEHYFVDNYWKLLGETLDTLRYLPEIKATHMHHSVSKAEKDATYNNSESKYWEDKARFQKYLDNRASLLIEKFI